MKRTELQAAELRMFIRTGWEPTLGYDRGASDCFTFKAFVGIEDGTIPRSGWSAEPLFGLNHLYVCGQTDDRYARKSDDFYALKVEYRDLYSSDARETAARAKTLTEIEKRLAALDARFGAPVDAAAYIGRVGDTLCVQRYGVPNNPRLRNDLTIHWTDVDGARRFLVNEIDQWRERRGVTKEIAS